jgi:chromosome segregation ATPase
MKEVLNLLQEREQELIQSIKMRDVQLQKLTEKLLQSIPMDESLRKWGSLNETISDLQKEIDRLQMGMKELQNEVKCRNEDIEHFRSIIGSKDLYHQSMKKEIDQIDHENMELNKLCKSLEKEKNWCLEQVHTLHSDIMEREKMIYKLKEEKQQVDEEIHSLKLEKTISSIRPLETTNYQSFTEATTPPSM